MCPGPDDEQEQTKAIPLSELLKEAGATGRRRSATLTVIAGRAIGKVYRLERSLTVLGRAADVDIVVEDEGVSRRHAQIAAVGESHVLTDLASRNGTIHNGHRLAEPVELHDGDRIRIGATTVFKFGLQDEIEEQMQARLYDSATRDALTQAYNRRFFDERLESEWAWSKRHGVPCALIAIDADHFKRINDGFGHAAGDYVLKQLVAIVQRVIRVEDVFARIGGEEFVVLARATPLPHALMMAERVRAAVASHAFVFGGVPLPVTISLGVSTSDERGVDSPTALLERADQWLYYAKQRGRNRVEPQLSAG